jgi:hypothetical protein
MKTFTIENETNNITLHTMIQDAEGVPNAEWFRNEAGLSKLAAEGPAARLVEIWNTLPGVTPVKKFKDRTTAVSRIWKAIQSLDMAEQAPVDESSPIPEKVPVTGNPEANSVADVPETASIADQEASETAHPEAVISDLTGPAPAKPVAQQRPTSHRKRLPRRPRPLGRRKRPTRHERRHAAGGEQDQPGDRHAQRSAVFGVPSRSPPATRCGATISRCCCCCHLAE